MWLMIAGSTPSNNRMKVDFPSKSSHLLVLSFYLHFVRRLLKFAVYSAACIRRLLPHLFYSTPFSCFIFHENEQSRLERSEASGATGEETEMRSDSNNTALDLACVGRIPTRTGLSCTCAGADPQPLAIRGASTWKSASTWQKKIVEKSVRQN